MNRRRQSITKRVLFFTDLVSADDRTLFIVNSIPDGRLRSMGRHADSARSIFPRPCMS